MNPIYRPSCSALLWLFCDSASVIINPSSTNSLHRNTFWFCAKARINEQALKRCIIKSLYFFFFFPFSLQLIFSFLFVEPNKGAEQVVIFKEGPFFAAQSRLVLQQCSSVVCPCLSQVYRISHVCFIQETCCAWRNYLQVTIFPWISGLARFLKHANLIRA